MIKPFFLLFVLTFSLISLSQTQYKTLGVSEMPLPQNIKGGGSNGIVGSTSGTAQVSQDGSASYTIPISIPTGTGGFAPQLSISYNSTANDGILGWGFNLNGLSVVSRTLANILCDNKISSVRIEHGDRFAVDGNKLIDNYMPEVNDLSCFTADNWTNPQVFTFRKGNGITYEYGGSVDSQVRGKKEDKNSVLFWLLNKVTDARGNYYTIKYGQKEHWEEYWPLRIDYTGNAEAGVSTTASIRFEYI